jgi:hypothetical protein
VARKHSLLPPTRSLGLKVLDFQERQTIARPSGEFPRRAVGPGPRTKDGLLESGRERPPLLSPAGRFRPGLLGWGKTPRAHCREHPGHPRGGSPVPGGSGERRRAGPVRPTTGCRECRAAPGRGARCDCGHWRLGPGQRRCLCRPRRSGPRVHAFRPGGRARGSGPLRAIRRSMGRAPANAQPLTRRGHPR